MGSRSPVTGLIAYRSRNTPVLGRSVLSRSISLIPLTCSAYAEKADRTDAGDPAASSTARSLSTATTKKVAPYSVSGRVV